MLRCAHCGSGDTLTLTDRVSCLICGQTTAYDHTALTKPGPGGAGEIRPHSE